MGIKRGGIQAATLAVCSPQVLRTHMQSAVRRALEAANSFYHGVVGGMSAFFFWMDFFLNSISRVGFWRFQVSMVMYKKYQEIGSLLLYISIYILYYYQDITLLLHMCIWTWKYMSRITLELSQVRINEAAFRSCFSYVFYLRCRALSLVLGLKQ